MSRLGLIKEDIVLSENAGFILSDEEGIRKVVLISIIGSGGTAIAYKGICEENGTKRACVVKEYFPREKELRGIYKREKVGEKITIIKERREEELTLQSTNVQRELRTTRTVFFDSQFTEQPGYNNNPYVYSSDFFCQMGDSSYVLLDTSEGETLYSAIQRLRDEGGAISVDYVLRVTRQLVEVVRHLHDRGFVHCDIKPQNIWMRGANENESVCLLDFGSTFKMEECCTRLENMNSEDIIKRADELFDMEGLGSSTSDYCSTNVVMIKNSKRYYYHARREGESIEENARNFLRAVNTVNISDDLHSVIRILKEMYDLTRLEDCEYDRTYEVIDGILDKNELEGYRNAGELLEDLDVLQTVAQRGAHPLVLEKAMDAELNSLGGIETIEELLCDVEVE